MAFLLYLRGHQPNDTSSIKRTAHETALTHTSLRQREQESLHSEDHKIHTHTHTHTLKDAVVAAVPHIRSGQQYIPDMEAD